MNAIIPYLIFTGECREAMTYYCEVFGGKITLMHSMAESPMPVPEADGHLIFNSEMRTGNLVIKASDNMPGNETLTGSNFSMFCTFSEAVKQKAAFERMASEGHILFPLANGFGMLKDKYNIQWMIALDV